MSYSLPYGSTNHPKRETLTSPRRAGLNSGMNRIQGWSRACLLAVSCTPRQYRGSESDTVGRDGVTHQFVAGQPTDLYNKLGVHSDEDGVSGGHIVELSHVHIMQNNYN